MSHDFKFQLNWSSRGPLIFDKSRVLDELKRTIRDVNNFPKAGIVFKDVTPVLLDSKLLAQAVQLMAEYDLEGPGMHTQDDQGRRLH